MNESIANKATYGVDTTPIYKDIFDVTKKATIKENIFYYKEVSGQTDDTLVHLQALEEIIKRFRAKFGKK